MTAVTVDQAWLVSLLLVGATVLLVALRRRVHRIAWERLNFFYRYSPIIGALAFGLTHASSVGDALRLGSEFLSSAALLMHVAAWLFTAALLWTCLQLALSNPSDPEAQR